MDLPTNVVDLPNKHQATGTAELFSPLDAYSIAVSVGKLMQRLPVPQWHDVLRAMALELLRRRADDEKEMSLRSCWAHAAQSLDECREALALLAERRRIREADRQQRLLEAQRETPESSPSYVRGVR